MIIERIDEGLYRYSVRYPESEQALCKFENLVLATRYVRYLRGCKLGEYDEHNLEHAIRQYDKMARKGCEGIIHEKGGGM